MATGVQSGTRGRGLGAWIARRVAVAALLALIVSFIVYAATTVLPGDVAAAILGRTATPEALAALREQLGLDQPFLLGYWDWLRGVLSGDLGISLAGTRAPVTELLRDALVNTLVLAACTLLVLIPVALAIGLYSGVRAGRAGDRVASGAALTLTAVPEFVIGAVGVLLLAVYLPFLPAVSLVPPGTSPLSLPEVLVLPVATLVLAGCAYLIRIVRASVIEVMASEYVELARLSGVPERRVILRYGLRNALAPTIQAVAATAQWLIGGVFVVEFLFAFPGIGSALVNSVTVRDVPVVQAVSLFIAVTFILINLVADVATVLVVPKLRTAR
jgi:peptide/nickel transport system permease protein